MSQVIDIFIEVKFFPASIRCDKHAYTDILCCYNYFYICIPMQSFKHLSDINVL